MHIELTEADLKDGSRDKPVSEIGFDDLILFSQTVVATAGRAEFKCGHTVCAPAPRGSWSVLPVHLYVQQLFDNALAHQREELVEMFAESIGSDENIVYIDMNGKLCRDFQCCGTMLAMGWPRNVGTPTDLRITWRNELVGTVDDERVTVLATYFKPDTALLEAVLDRFSS